MKLMFFLNLIHLLPNFVPIYAFYFGINGLKWGMHISSSIQSYDSKDLRRKKESLSQYSQ